MQLISKNLYMDYKKKFITKIWTRNLYLKEETLHGKNTVPNLKLTFTTDCPNHWKYFLPVKVTFLESMIFLKALAWWSKNVSRDDQIWLWLVTVIKISRLSYIIILQSWLGDDHEESISKFRTYLNLLFY